MAKKPKPRPVPVAGSPEPSDRAYADRERLSQICKMWDSDKTVSLVCYAMRDEPNGDIYGRALVMTDPHHGLEIIYRLAKAIVCPCGHPECHVTQFAQSLVAVMDQQRAKFEGNYVQH